MCDKTKKLKFGLLWFLGQKRFKKFHVFQTYLAAL